MRTLDVVRGVAAFALGLLLSSSSSAQTSNPAPRTGAITGRVLAEDGTVIVGASVFVEPKA